MSRPTKYARIRPLLGKIEINNDTVVTAVGVIPKDRFDYVKGKVVVLKELGIKVSAKQVEKFYSLESEIQIDNCARSIIMNKVYGR